MAHRDETDGKPEDDSSEQSQYRTYVLEKIARALVDSDDGRLVDDSEVERRMRRWLEQ